MVAVAYRLGPMRFLPLVALALTGATTPQQFDLVCTGTVTSVGQPTTRRYHVDLQARKWCAGVDQCAVRDIAEIDPDVIWFERHQPTYRGDMKITHYVERTTGKWVWILDAMDTEGTCEPAPFTGFPTAPTRF